MQRELCTYTQEKKNFRAWADRIHLSDTDTNTRSSVPAHLNATYVEDRQGKAGSALVDGAKAIWCRGYIAAGGGDKNVADACTAVIYINVNVYKCIKSRQRGREGVYIGIFPQ